MIEILATELAAVIGGVTPAVEMDAHAPKRTAPYCAWARHALSARLAKPVGSKYRTELDELGADIKDCEARGL